MTGPTFLGDDDDDLAAAEPPPQLYVGMELWRAVMFRGDPTHEGSLSLTLDSWRERPARLSCRQRGTESIYALTRAELLALRTAIDVALGAPLPR